MSGVHLFSMWEQVSKTAHVACKEQNCVGSSASKRTKCLQAWNKSSPTIIIITIIIIIIINFFVIVIIIIE